MLRSVILKNRFFKGILSCLIAGSVFGAQWPIAGSALQIVDPYWFTLIRYLIVASILAIILFYKEGKDGFKLNRRPLFPKYCFWEQWPSVLIIFWFLQVRK
ncbi:EamA family transporter [Streptococcus salivarius]|uniref:EamA family transporter n=1 Tax=Streptococcus salivarius TaxID=1304 RepID=UPI002180CF17|nr:EamA family transporter [Streptococcus salivarius]